MDLAASIDPAYGHLPDPSSVKNIQFYLNHNLKKKKSINCEFDYALVN